MQNLIPYLMFNGNCEEALNFYKDCLDGEIAYMGRFGDGPMEVPESAKNKVMHAGLNFPGGSLMASDHFEDAGYTTDPKGSNVHLSLGMDDVEKMEIVFSKLSEGGIVTMPLADQFWGDRFGMLVDKYGFHWMLSCTVKKKEK